MFINVHWSGCQILFQKVVTNICFWSWANIVYWAQSQTIVTWDMPNLNILKLFRNFSSWLLPVSRIKIKRFLSSFLSHYTVSRFQIEADEYLLHKMKVIELDPRDTQKLLPPCRRDFTVVKTREKWEGKRIRPTSFLDNWWWQWSEEKKEKVLIEVNKFCKEYHCHLDNLSQVLLEVLSRHPNHRLRGKVEVLSGNPKCWPPTEFSNKKFSNENVRQV